ncbi:hypothetical protein ACTMU2_32005 [Cupriavidus basilensis]
MAETSHVLYSSVVDKDGDQYTPTTLTPTEDQREKIILAKLLRDPDSLPARHHGNQLEEEGREGHRLAAAQCRLAGAADLISQLFSYVFKNTKDRAGDLETNTVEVDSNGPIDAGQSGLPKNVSGCTRLGGIDAFLLPSVHGSVATLPELPFRVRLQM